MSLACLYFSYFLICSIIYLCLINLAFLLDLFDIKNLAYELYYSSYLYCYFILFTASDNLSNKL